MICKMKLKKLNGKSLFAVLFLILLVGCQKNDILNSDTHKLDLSSLYNSDNGYCYSNIEWGSSIKNIEKVIKSDLEEGHLLKNEELNLDGKMMYVNNPIELFGFLGSQSMEFNHDKLINITFQFNPTQENSSADMDEFFDKIVSTLETFYGEATDISSNSGEIEPDLSSSTTKYLWSSNKTKDGFFTNLQVVNLKLNENPGVIYITLAFVQDDGSGILKQ